MNMRLLIIIFGLFFPLILNAQVSKSLNITAGSLATALTVNELQTVTNLTLTGTIDARDFKANADLSPQLAENQLKKE